MTTHEHGRPAAIGPAGIPTLSGANVIDNPQTADDRLCPSEFPGDDSFAGQLCERERGHDGEHEHLAVIAGTRYTRRLVWPAEVTR